MKARLTCFSGNHWPDNFDSYQRVVKAMYVSPVHLNFACKAIAEGGVIAYPTEAVWGLGCDPWSDTAVFKLLQMKERPWQKGLILVASDMKQIAPLLDHLTKTQLTKLEMSWPGPFTWVLPDPDGWVPEWSRGQHQSVAVRITAHPLVRQLCDRYGRPIISTSANLAGKEPARTKQQLDTRLFADLDYLMPGETQDLAQPSVIRDIRTDEIYRV